MKLGRARENAKGGREEEKMRREREREREGERESWKSGGGVERSDSVHH